MRALRYAAATRRQTCSGRRDERREFLETGMFLRAPLTSDFKAGGVSSPVRAESFPPAGTLFPIR